MDKEEVEENSDTKIFNNESESATLNDVEHEKDINEETKGKDSEQTVKDEFDIKEES